MESILGDHILGMEDTSIALSIQRALVQHNMTMTAAESCTGGLIASLVTKEPGASSVFGTGFITYSNEAKQALLDVTSDELNLYGAVSEPVVRSMLQGALARSGADIGVAISGIAGPDGGTEEKPVGTVWIAWGTRSEHDAVVLKFPAERAVFQSIAAAVALDLVRRQVMGLPKFPDYVRRQAG